MAALSFLPISYLYLFTDLSSCVTFHKFRLYHRPAGNYFIRIAPYVSSYSLREEQKSFNVYQGYYIVDFN